MIRLLIVDDNALDRDGLRLSLMDEDGLEVVGEAVNGAEALEQAAQLLPDVVLMDLRMPVMGGVEATRQLIEMPDPPQVLILTTYDTEPDVRGALKAGAAGYLPKNAPTHDLLRAIKGCLQGGSVIPQTRAAARPQQAEQTGPTGGQAPSRPAKERPGGGLLEDMELQVLRLVASGYNNGQAAYKLAIPESEVKAHLISVYRKLGKQDRSGAVGEAYRRNLLD